MAITTYDELLTAGASWANRTDLADRWPEFVALAEADFNTELDIRTVETDQTLTLTSALRSVALPTGFYEALNLWPEWDYGRGEPLRRVMPELLIETDTSGLPRVWCVKGSTIAFDCPADQTYTFTLRQRGGVALTSTDPTNYVLTKYPNVYLFGMLREAFGYLEDSENEARFVTRYTDALAKAKQAEGRDKGRVTLSTEPGALTFYGHRRGFNINRGY